MKIIYNIQMFLKQKYRDRIGLFLSIFTAPLFVIFYWIIFGGTAIVYNVNISMSDSVTVGTRTHITNAAYQITNLSDNHTDIKIQTTIVPLDEFRHNLRSEQTDLGIEFPETFLLPDAISAPVKFHVTGQSKSRTVLELVKPVIYIYACKELNAKPPVIFETIASNNQGQPAPFDSYVPGLIVFAVIMLIFSSSISIVKEVEAGTFSRILLSRTSPIELLIAASFVQFSIGVLTVALTFITALICGFNNDFAFLPAISATSVACLSHIGIGMIIAGLSKNQTRSFLFSSIAMFLLVLFSGIIFPIPEFPIFTIGTKSIDLFDALPTTHLSHILHKTVFSQATFSDIWYEILGLSSITVITFVCGSFLFIRVNKPALNTWEGLL